MDHSFKVWIRPDVAVDAFVLPKGTQRNSAGSHVIRNREKMDTSLIFFQKMTTRIHSSLGPSNINEETIGGAQNTTTTTNRARELLEVLTKRYDFGSSSKQNTRSKRQEQWSKTRAYLYRACDRLTFKQVQDVTTFLDSIVSPTTSAHILQTTPRILRKPVDSFLQPTAGFLRDLWGPDLFQEAILRNPQLLLSSGVGYTQNEEKADKDIEVLLLETAGLSEKNLKKFKKSAPFVFGLPKSKVEGVLRYLLNILSYLPSVSTRRTSKNSAESKISTSTAVLAKVLVAHPYLLNLSVENNLQPRVEFLQNSCGLNQTEVAKMVKTSAGSVLGLSVEHNLKPTMDYLAEILDAREGRAHNETGEQVSSSERNLGVMASKQAALRKCLLAHPQLLALSLSNLQCKVDYFQGLEHLQSKDSKMKSSLLASRIAFRCPAVYSLSLNDNIIPTIEFLKKVWGFSRHTKQELSESTSNGSLAECLQEYPNILTLSLEGNIQPTMNFYNRTGYTVLTAKWELVPGETRIRGRYIAASLYNRLLPRWHYCLSRASGDVAATSGDATTSSTTPSNSEPSLAQSPPLHILVGASENQFCQDYQVDKADFLDFKEAAIPRLKFSSQFDTWLKTGRPIDI